MTKIRDLLNYINIMDVGTINLLVQMQKTFSQFLDSRFFFGVKILLAIYVSVLLVDIILIIIIGTPGMYLRVIRSGANIPMRDKDKMQKRWEKVKSRLKNGNSSQYKLAVLEADKIADEILAKVGYAGSNMGERLEGISSSQLEMIEDLKQSHEVRNEIVYKPDFALDRKRAEEVLVAYQKMLEMLQFI